MTASRHEHPGEQEDYRGSEWYYLWEHCRVPMERIWQHEEPVYFVALSPDETRIVTAGQDSVVRIFDRSTQRLLLSIDTEQAEVNCASFSPSGNTLASAGDDGTIRLWHLDQDSGEAQPGVTFRAHENQAYNVAWIDDGTTLVTAGRDPVIRLWESATGTAIGTLEGHTDTAGEFALSPDGSTLASVGSDEVLIIWDLATRQPRHRIRAGNGRLTSVDYSADGGRVVTGGVERRISIWDSDTGELVETLTHLDEIQCVQFSADGHSVISGDRAGTIRFWPLSSAQPDDSPAPPSTTGRAWRAHPGRLYRMAATSDGAELCSVGRDGWLMKWPDLHRRTEPVVIRKPGVDLLDMTLAGDECQVVTVDQQSVDLWDSSTGAHLKQLYQASEQLRSVDVSADGQVVAVGGLDGRIDVFAIDQTDTIRTFHTGSAAKIDQIALSRDGARVAAVSRYGGQEDDFFVFDVATGRRIPDFRLIDSNSARFSPDGNRIFVSGPSNTLLSWDLRTGARRDALARHESPINRIAVNDSGTLLATASGDRHIKIWKTENLELLHELGSHRDEAIAVTFTHDGLTLASTSGDGILMLTHVASGRELMQLDLPSAAQRLQYSAKDRQLGCLLERDGELSDSDFVLILPWR